MEYDYSDNTKLRIVLLLDKDTNKIITKLNKDINKNIDYDIQFNKNCIPHITLISGILKNKLDYQETCEIINNTINLYFNDKLNINFDKFYYSLDKNWLFLGIQANKNLLKFIEELRKKLSKHFELSDARHLHVTIAKSSELYKNFNLINNLYKPNDFKADTICIGLSGDNGILENIITKFKVR